MQFHIHIQDFLAIQGPERPEARVFSKYILGPRSPLTPCPEKNISFGFFGALQQCCKYKKNINAFKNSRSLHTTLGAVAPGVSYTFLRNNGGPGPAWQMQNNIFIPYSLCSVQYHRSCFDGDIVQHKLYLPNIRHKSQPQITPLVAKINQRLFYQGRLTPLLANISKTRPLRTETFHNEYAEKRLFYKKKQIATVNIHSSSNNTLLTLTGAQGKVFSGGWASAGTCGFKHSRKSTTYASQAAAKQLALKAKSLGIKALHLKLYGTGRAKGAVVRTLRQCRLKVLLIRECTPVIHNGCRSPKKRRI